MEGTLEELRRISNCPEGATFSQLGLRKSVVMLRGVGGWTGRGCKNFRHLPEGAAICCHNNPSIQLVTWRGGGGGRPAQCCKNFRRRSESGGLSGSRNLLHRFWCPDFGKALE